MKQCFIILLFIMVSCKETPVKSLKNRTENKVVLQDSTRVIKKMLLDKSQANAIFGKPIQQEKIPLNELYGEFRGNIYYKYTDKERQGESIYIEELTWEKDSVHHITIWYEVQQEKRIPKAYLVWKIGSEF
ncbi:MAG: hypothetical protein OIF50_01570 [Flavobacteriaceae bacterium]|nr:hypothetical protein [Flavobacteriaceae bacterium]